MDPLNAHASLSARVGLYGFTLVCNTCRPHDDQRDSWPPYSHTVSCNRPLNKVLHCYKRLSWFISNRYPASDRERSTVMRVNTSHCDLHTRLDYTDEWHSVAAIDWRSLNWLRNWSVWLWFYFSFVKKFYQIELTLEYQCTKYIPLLFRPR